MKENFRKKERGRVTEHLRNFQKQKKFSEIHEVQGIDQYRYFVKARLHSEERKTSQLLVE